MSEEPFVRCIKVTAATVSATIEVSNPIAQQPGAVTMHCSTNLQISPIIPRLPRACALFLILSLLVRTSHPVAITERLWLPAITIPTGRWCKQKVRRHCVPTVRWAPLLARLLARCALLGVLLHTSGWLRATPLCWGVLLLPVTQILALKFMPCVVTLAPARSAGGPKQMRRWMDGLQRLYQLLLVALLVSTLGQLWRLFDARATGLPCAVFLGTWRTQPDEETELSVTTLDQDRYQVTWRGTFSLLWEPRDSFERWILILLLRKLKCPGASRLFLAQHQVAEAFDTQQWEVSRWERLVRQHGWHILSDRYRHQLHSALPDPELSRQILDLWIPAFWLSAWDVRERIIPDRSALPLESLHKLAQHTGFAQVRQTLLERFLLQDGQLIAREHWWLNELLALNERLLVKLEQGGSITPQEIVDVEPLRLKTPRRHADAAAPPLAAALQSVLFQPQDHIPDGPVCCTYCGSDHTAPKSKKPRIKTVIDPLSGQKQHIQVLRHYCHNPDCSHKTFTHFPPGVLPHSPHPLHERLIALEVYEVLLSTYRRSARMFAVSTATCYRWVAAFSPAALALAAYLGVIRTSGVVGIDDKWILVCSPAELRPHGKRLRAVWRYAYFAVDVYSYDLLALALYPQHNDQAVHLLLLELKAKGVYPRIVVTDLDPAYGRMLPIVFPKAVHHECIFHAIQNALTQLTRVYGRYYAEHNLQAAALHDAVVHLFRAKTQKTVRQRFYDLLALRQDYVAQTPEVACVFDSLERHFPKLVNAIENPLIPKTNNATELVIRRFDQHYQSMCGLDSLESARLYLRVFEFVYRLTPFASDNPTRRIRGKCPLQLAGYDLDALPIAQFFGQLKLPTPVAPGEEVVPMA
jgi:transposase-like protein